MWIPRKYRLFSWSRSDPFTCPTACKSLPVCSGRWLPFASSLHATWHWLATIYKPLSMTLRMVSHWLSRYCHAAFRWRFWRMVVIRERASKPVFISLLIVNCRVHVNLASILLVSLGIYSTSFLVIDLKTTDDNSLKLSSFLWQWPIAKSGIWRAVLVLCTVYSR